MIERRDTSAPGQALEFEIWSDLIKQSHGALHVFLPLLDRGLDAVIHRLTDGQYIPVQVKGRHESRVGEVDIVVRGGSLVDDRALLIGAMMDDVPGRVDLVIEEGEFKRLANTSMSGGHEILSAAWSLPVHDQNRWRPYLVPREELAERILGTKVEDALATLEPQPQVEPMERREGWLGFLGESEVIRRLAENPQLDLFRPFPDLEMVEILARNNVSGRFAGLQVKAATLPSPAREVSISIRKSTLSFSATTWLIGLVWQPDIERFADDCVLIPAAALPSVSTDDGPRLELELDPFAKRHTRLDPYRRRLVALSNAVNEACEHPTVEVG